MRTLLDFATRVTVDARDPHEMARERDAQVEALRRMLREARLALAVADMAACARSGNGNGARP